jgi:DNA-directed RNA polymerase specialized sigma24 family protein
VRREPLSRRPTPSSCVATPVKEKERLDPAFTWSSLERASDERLMALVRGGVDIAIEAIVRRYQPALVRHASRFLDPEHAELVVQDALVKGLIQIQDDQKRVHLRSLLFRVVHNEAVDSSRRRITQGESRDEGEGDAESAEYLARVERLRGIVVGANRPPAMARAEATETPREEIVQEFEETRANVAMLIERARSSLRTAGGTIVPRQQIKSWFENLRSPGMRGLVSAGAAAVVVATVAGAATLGSHGGGVDSGSTKPSASSSSDSKPKVAGPRREGGTRTPGSNGPSKAKDTQAPEQAPTQTQQVAPPASGGTVTSGPTSTPKQGSKKKSKPNDQGNSGEDVTVLGEKKKGTTSSGSQGTTGTQGPNSTGSP